MSESEKKLAFATKQFQSVKRFSFLMKLRVCFYFFDSMILFFLKKTVPEKSSKKRIGILLLPGMGDCIIFCRLADSLKKALLPDQYELTILSNDTHQKLLTNFFDNVQGFPFYKMSFNPFARIRILSQLRQLVFDELWDLNGCGECTPNIFISNAVCAAEKKVAYPGLLDYGKRKNICPGWIKRKIYTEIVDLPVKIHLLDVFQKFFQHVSGKTIYYGNISFPMKKPSSIPERYLVMIPCGSQQRNMWSGENFVELGKNLYLSKKLPVILCGAESDRCGCAVIAEKLSSAGVIVINMAGRTIIDELAWVLSHADEVFTIDTGSFHLAVAVGAKTTVIAPDAVFSLYSNYPEDLGKNLRKCHSDVACKNCGNNCYFHELKSYPCLGNLTVEHVLNNKECDL